MENESGTRQEAAVGALATTIIVLVCIIILQAMAM